MISKICFRLLVPALALFFACGKKPALEVDGQRVTHEELRALYKHYNVEGDAAREKFETNLIDAMLMANAAENDALDEQPLTIALINQQRRQLLANGWREHFLSKAASDKAVREYYQAHISEFTKKVYDLRQIVVRYDANDEQAVKKAKLRVERAYDSLRKGLDFAVVAGVESDDLSARNKGGAVGKVTLDEVPEELRDVLQKLEPGGFTAPIQSRFGLHILHLAAPPEPVVKSYESVAAKLRVRVAQERLAEKLAELRREARIERTDTGSLSDK